MTNEEMIALLEDSTCSSNTMQVQENILKKLGLTSRGDWNGTGIVILHLLKNQRKRDE